MRNRPLTLVQLHQGLYDATTACAYIYYGTPQQPVDHTNQAIGDLIGDTRRDELTNHVQSVIMPKVSKALEHSIYDCKDIDFVNMSPHPCLVIKRRDSKTLSEQDLSSIDGELQSFIQKNNQGLKNQRSAAAMFQANNTHQTPDHQTNPGQGRYNLRSNRR